LKGLSWINFVLGLWLIVAAFALPARSGAVRAEESIAGIVVAVLAYVAVVGRPRAGISWSVAIAGVWLVLVSYGALTPARINAMLVGLLVLAIGTANAIYWHVPHRHANGH